MVRHRPSALSRTRVGLAAVAAVVVFAACSATGPSTRPAPSPTPARASSAAGSYELTLSLPSSTWTTDQAITGTATLSLTSGHSAELMGSSTVLNFQYSEVGGTRHTDPIWDAVCEGHQLLATTPLTSPLGKTGAATDDFNAAFLPGSDIHLPAGRWDITALADFSDTPGCGPPTVQLRATVEVTVTGR
jgi:hypothetical protein